MLSEKNIFSMSEIIEEGFKIKQSRILDNILVTGNKLSNQRTGYQKTATLKAAFLEKKPSYFYMYTWLESIIVALANCLNVVIS